MQWVVAITVVAELGDLTRFDNPRQLAAFVGLVPSEYSSGPARRQGGITKAGNGRARRVLVEAAWAYRHPAKVSAHIQQRIDQLAETTPGHRLESAGPALQTLSSARRARQASQRRRHRDRPRTDRLHVGDRSRRCPLSRVIDSQELGRDVGPDIGATLDDVKRRLRSTLVPRPRQAPDGSQYGGTQSTDISRINRRQYRSRLSSAPGPHASDSAACADRSMGGRSARRPRRDPRWLVIVDPIEPAGRTASYLTREVISTLGFSGGGLMIHPAAVDCKPFRRFRRDGTRRLSVSRWTVGVAHTRRRRRLRKPTSRHRVGRFGSTPGTTRMAVPRPGLDGRLQPPLREAASWP